MSMARKLREDMKSGRLVVAPGAYDCVTARLVEAAGFGCVYMTGGGTAGTLGFPDYGLTTMSEMADNAGRLARVLNVPLIADADTGYGNELNVTRTVREYEMRGVAAIQIEDQGFPKKCGHLQDKTIIPLNDFIRKIRAAAAARRNSDTIIVARTDARGGAGFGEAVDRMNASLEAGADVAFLEAHHSDEEMEQIPKLIKGPCLLNVGRFGKSPAPHLKRVADMGYAIAILPGMLLTHVIGSCEHMLKELRETQAHPVPFRDLTIHELWRYCGAEEWDKVQERFK